MTKVGRKYDLPFVQLVDGQGEMTKETPYAGLLSKKADRQVLKDLEAEGKLFAAPKFEHGYPHCWRCNTPLIYYARESWFIKMTAVKGSSDFKQQHHQLDSGGIGKGSFWRLADKRSGLGT